MSTLVMIGVLFAFAGFAALAMNRRFEEQLPLSVGVVISVLYVFALLGALQAGMYAVLLLAAAALAGQAVLLIRGRKNASWKQLLTPGCAVFFLLAAWVLISFRGHMFDSWDDFSHWGLAVKNMSLFGALPSAVPESTITYRDYPPATTLLSWMWSELSGVYNEGDVQRAVNMMTMCFLLPAMRDQEWKKPGKALCMSTLLFMLPLFFNFFSYEALQVDTLLGCMVFYGLYAWFLCEKKGAMLGIGMTVFLLTLTKGTGTLMAGMLIAFIGVDLLVDKQKTLSEKIRLLICLLIPLIVGKVSWTLFLRIHQVPRVWKESGPSVLTVVRALLGRGTPQQKSIIGLTLEKVASPELWSENGGAPVNLVLWMLVLWIARCWIMTQCSDEEEKRSLKIAHGCLFVGALAYVLILLYTYVFVFRSDEAIWQASIDRYLSSYMIPLVGFTMMVLIRKLDQKGLPGTLSAPVCLLACAVLILNPANVVKVTATTYIWNEEIYEKRMNNLIPQKVIDHLDAQTDHVYLVVTNDNGKEYYRSAYQFTPIRIQEGMWTTWPVTERLPYYSEISAIQYSPSEWAKVLNEGGFTYVYLDTIDDRFMKDYRSLFEEGCDIESGKLYQIERVEQGVILHPAW